MKKKKKSLSKMKCWQGYERVPGTKAGAKGSCRKKSGVKVTGRKRTKV